VLITDIATRTRIIGSAQKNTQPIIDALRPYIEKSLNPHLAESESSSFEGNIATRPRNRNGQEGENRPKIIELASGTGEHLAAYAIEWTGVDWVGSERGYVSESCLARPSLV
jgi:hypothetical protein